MANDKPQELFDNVFQSNSPGMNGWPASVQTVQEQIAAHQAKFNQAPEQDNDAGPISTEQP